MSILNQILYGPPGTGKTHNTINLAVELAYPIVYNKNFKDNRGFLFNNADEFFIDRLNKINLTDLIDDLNHAIG